ncbi:MAG: Loki-CTERM sorting domain-containing protein [Promethearchaeota archaeon]
MKKLKMNAFLLCLLLLVSFSSVTGIKNAKDKNQSAHIPSNKPLSQDLTVLNYGEWAGYYWDDAAGNDEISWSFSSSNSYVGITVMMMDSANYYNFDNGYSYTYYPQSSGNFISDSGTFTVPYSDTWYVIFVNWDSDMQSTMLTYSGSITYNYFNGYYVGYNSWRYTYFLDPLADGIMVDWEFTGSNTYVGITAMAMDDEQYWDFSNGYSYTYYSLSSGGYWSDSGRFTIPYEDVWYFVFWNYDSDQQPTDLVHSLEIVDDNYEDNDEIGAAYPISEGFYPDLVCNDDDWFKIWVNTGELIQVLIEFSDINGDIDLELYNPSQVMVDASSSSTDDEYVEYIADTAGNYYIHIDDFEINPNYDMTLTISVPDDEYEDNDDFASAPLISEGYYPDLAGLDEDYYKIYLDESQIIDVLIEFYNSEGDLDLGLFDSSEILVAASATTTDDEQISYTTVTSGYYYILVDNYESNPHYDMTITITSVVEDDIYEDNDDFQHATPVTEGIYSNLCALDDDWYVISLQSDQQIIIDLYFSHAVGDIDVAFLDDGANVLGISETTTDNEHIDVMISSTGTYYILVYVFDQNPNYSMEIDVIAAGTTDDTTTDDTTTDDTTTDDTTTDDTTTDDTTTDDNTTDDTDNDDLSFGINNIPGFNLWILVLAVSITVIIILWKRIER